MAQTLPLSLIVNVNITRQTIFPTASDFGSFNFVGVSDTIPINERIRTYNSLDGVAADFDSLSEEYKAASAWFNTGVTPVPNLLYISRWANVALAGELRTGTPLVDTDAWALVNDGSFRITIDGVAANIVGIDFTGVTTMVGVAAIVQAELVAAGFVGATCVFNDKQNRFIIKSGTTGASSTITYLETSMATVGTDISGLTGAGDYLNGRSEANGALLNQGMAAESVTDGLNAINSINDSWFGFGFDKVARDNSSAREASEWAEPRVKLFVNATNDVNVLSSSSTNDIAAELKTAGRFQTILMYHQDSEYYPDVTYAARGFVLPAGTETWKFKRLSGIPVTPLTQNQFAVLTGKNCNAYVEFGGIGITVEGVTSGGEFIDIIRGVYWMQNLIQTSVYSILLAPTKVPYSDAGVTQLLSGVTSSLEQGVLRGFFAERIDEEGNVLPAFEVNALPVSQVPIGEKSARQYNYITFDANLAGAIHYADISGNVTVAL